MTDIRRFIVLTAVAVSSLLFVDISWPKIIEDFANEHDIEPTEKEIEGAIAFYTTIMKKLQDEGEVLSEVEQKDIQQTYREMSVSLVKRYNLDKALYEKFGGVVIFQQGNPSEPIGAYLGLIKSLQEQGELEFYDKGLESSFLRYYSKNHRMVVPPEQVDFSSPWWESIIK